MHKQAYGEDGYDSTYTKELPDWSLKDQVRAAANTVYDSTVAPHNLKYYLLGAGLGGALGAGYEYYSNPELEDQERKRRAIIGGTKGALAGAGAVALPNFMSGGTLFKESSLGDSITPGLMLLGAGTGAAANSAWEYLANPQLKEKERLERTAKAAVRGALLGAAVKGSTSELYNLALGR